jgi:hypothetical protein
MDSIEALKASTSRECLIEKFFHRQLTDESPGVSNLECDRIRFGSATITIEVAPL